MKTDSNKAEAIAALKRILKPGSTVYTVLRHVSRSGMRREISLFAVHKGECVSLDFWAAQAMGYRRRCGGGLVANGCGMDMGFHLVYSLGRTLAWSTKQLTRVGTRNGQAETNSGYALTHRWL